MFDEIDRAYYERRSREEREKAEGTNDPGIKRMRLDLSVEYAEKAKSLIREPT